MQHHAYKLSRGNWISFPYGFETRRCLVAALLTLALLYFEPTRKEVQSPQLDFQTRRRGGYGEGKPEEHTSASEEAETLAGERSNGALLVTSMSLEQAEPARGLLALLMLPPAREAALTSAFGNNPARRVP